MRCFLQFIIVLTLVTLTALSAWAQGGDVAGTFFNEGGQPMGGASMLLQDGQGITTATSVTDAQGHFDFPSIAPGSYVLMATEKDAVLGSTAVSVGDAPVQKDLILRTQQTLNVVIARKAEARNDISPETGTSTYKLDSSAIASLPQGQDTSFDKVLEQAPGVAQDSFGQTHIRGEHADAQYRLNGILLPDGISGFGQTIDSRIIDSATLLDGTLPAQYGLRTAGVVDIQTRSGFANGGQFDFQGGSYGNVQPSISYGGTEDNLEYFLNASHLTSDVGIEAPTPSTRPIHDHTEQDKQFAYMSYLLDPTQRVDLIVGNSIANFEIPNNPGQTSNFCVGSNCSFNSSQLDETQHESDQYATLAWQGQQGPIDIQVAPYMRYSEIHFHPDEVGDLIFNGVASDVLRTDLAYGVQADGSYRLNFEHTLRGGLSLQQEHAVNDNTSQVFAANADGTQSSTTPATIVDNNQKDGQLYGIYLQDEWKITHDLTMNYGARFDAVEAYVDESQISPRLSLVYKVDDQTTLHGGYARYFTPPPLELVAPSSINKFEGTTNAPTTTQDDQVKSERSHNFDIGAAHQLTDEIKLGVDGYYKIVHDLLDEGQFGQAVVFTPFNYEQGRIEGIEFTASYTGKKLKGYGNFAISRAVGEKIVSSQFNFTDPAELAFISSNFVHLDHDQTFTGSGGISYIAWQGTEFGVDTVFGSGLRDGFSNSQSLPWYAQFNASITQDLDLFPKDKTQLRFSIINLFDTSYELRDGTGIGVGAPQWGPRRGFYLGLSQAF